MKQYNFSKLLAILITTLLFQGRVVAWKRAFAPKDVSPAEKKAPDIGKKTPDLKKEDVKKEIDEQEAQPMSRVAEEESTAAPRSLRIEKVDDPVESVMLKYAEPVKKTIPADSDEEPIKTTKKASIEKMDLDTQIKTLENYLSKNQSALLKLGNNVTVVDAIVDRYKKFAEELNAGNSENVLKKLEAQKIYLTDAIKKGEEEAEKFGEYSKKSTTGANLEGYKKELVDCENMISKIQGMKEIKDTKVVQKINQELIDELGQRATEYSQKSVEIKKKLKRFDDILTKIDELKNVKKVEMKKQTLATVEQNAKTKPIIQIKKQLKELKKQMAAAEKESSPEKKDMITDIIKIYENELETKIERINKLKKVSNKQFLADIKTILNLQKEIDGYKQLIPKEPSADEMSIKLEAENLKVIKEKEEALKDMEEKYGAPADKICNSTLKEIISAQSKM